MQTHKSKIERDSTYNLIKNVVKTKFIFLFQIFIHNTSDAEKTIFEVFIRFEKLLYILNCFLLACYFYRSKL